MKWERSGAFRRKNKRKYQKRRKMLFTALTALCALVFVFSAVKLALYFRSSARTAQVNDGLRQLHEASIEREETEPTCTDVPSVSVESDVDSEMQEIESEPLTVEPEPQDLCPGEYQRIGSEISDEAKQLYEINPDLVAWLNIPNVLSLPVVYRDNSYYLTHDFYGKESDSGTLFLDVQHPLQQNTQFLFIHGHNMYDGSMFGTLAHYRNSQYVRDHPQLTLNTLYSHDTYEIIGSLYVTEAEMVTIAGMGRATFADASKFGAFIENMRAHAMHFTDAEIPSDAALLALSTCFESGRVVVVFQRTASEKL